MTRMYDEIKHQKRKEVASETALTLMWLTVGAGLGWGSEGAMVVVFGVLFAASVVYFMLVMRQR